MQHLSQAAQKHAHDPITQARVLLAEQSQNFDVMRSAIGKIGTSLAHLNEVEPEAQHPHATALLNAQAEAIQGLTLLVLKGQQVQAELINAVDGQSARAGCVRNAQMDLLHDGRHDGLEHAGDDLLAVHRRPSRPAKELARLADLNYRFRSMDGVAGDFPCSTPRNCSTLSGPGSRHADPCRRRIRGGCAGAAAKPAARRLLAQARSSAT